MKPLILENYFLLDNTNLDAHQTGVDTRTVMADLFFIDATSTLIADGNSPGTLTISGDLANMGTLEMSDGAADDTVIVSGDYAGAGSTLSIDAALDATEVADTLVIEGSVVDVTVGAPASTTVAAGPTSIAVTDVGDGSGSITGTGAGAGIAVVDVSATGGTDADDFALSAPVTAGVYEYTLNLESDGIWYLQTDDVTPTIDPELAAVSAIGGFWKEGLTTLHERLGNMQQHGNRNVWVNTVYRDGAVNPAINPLGVVDFEQRMNDFQVGIDGLVNGENTKGRLYLGAIFGEGNTTVDISDNDGEGRVDIQTLGGYLTYVSPTNVYVDTVIKYQWLDFNVESDSEGVDIDYDGENIGISVEVGKEFHRESGWQLTPEAQLAYSTVDHDDYAYTADGADFTVKLEDSESLMMRAGLRVQKNLTWKGCVVSPFMTADVTHEFDGETTLEINDVDITTDVGGTGYALGVGTTLQIGKNTHIYAKAEYNDGDHQESQFEGRLGLKVNF